MSLVNHYQRLLKCEFELNVGEKWFETFYDLLKVETQEEVDPRLLDLAKRLDAVLQEMSVDQTAGKSLLASLSFDAPRENDAEDTNKPLEEKNNMVEESKVPDNTEQLTAETATEVPTTTSTPEEILVEKPRSKLSAFLETSATTTTTPPHVITKSTLVIEATKPVSPSPSSPLSVKDRMAAFTKSPSVTKNDERERSSSPMKLYEPSPSNSPKNEVDTTGMSVKDRLAVYTRTTTSSSPKTPSLMEDDERRTTASPLRLSEATTNSPKHASSPEVDTTGMSVKERMQAYKQVAQGSSRSNSPATPTKVTKLSEQPPQQQEEEESQTQLPEQDKGDDDQAIKAALSEDNNKRSFEEMSNEIQQPPQAKVETKEVEPMVKPGEEDVQASMHNDNEGGHMVVGNECVEAFNNLKLRKKHRYLIFKIENWKLNLVKVGDKSAGQQEFLNDLPFAECRFCVYDHERVKSDQYGTRVAPKAFFIMWTPVPAPTQMKMLYSTERKTLTKCFVGVEDLTCVKKDDILVGVGAKGKFDEDDSGDEERGGNNWMDE